MTDFGREMHRGRGGGDWEDRVEPRRVLQAGGMEGRERRGGGDGVDEFAVWLSLAVEVPLDAQL